jgi:hypothetical protein
VAEEARLDAEFESGAGSMTARVRALLPGRAPGEMLGRFFGGEVVMAKPILVGYDPDAGDQAPVEFGIAVAEFTGAPLIVGAVHASAAALGPNGEGLVEEQLVDGHGESMDHLGAELRRHGIKVECAAPCLA